MPGFLSDAPFWALVGLVALLLAFGRYAPFYRLFYAIPYMSYLRAPVKFMRLVEFSAAVLAGSGLAALMARDCDRRLRAGFAYAALAAAAASVFYALHVNASADSFAAILGKLGARQLMGPMTQYAVRALWHAILGFGLVSALAFALARGKCRGQTAATVILVAFSIDVFIATRPFMFTVDKSLSYKPNAVTETVRGKLPATEIPTVAVLGVRQVPEWFRESLSLHGIRRVPYDDVDNNAFLSNARGGVAALCREAGAQHLVIPATLSRAIDRSVFDHVFFFNLGANGITKAQTPAQSSLELLRARETIPYCAMHARWTGVDETMLAHKIAAGGAALAIGADIPCPNAADSNPPASCKTLSRRLQKGHFTSKIETDSTAECMLLVLERKAWKLPVWVDGASVEPVAAGYGPFIGVHLAPGRHTVNIGKSPSFIPPLFSVVALLAFFGGTTLFARRAARG